MRNSAAERRWCGNESDKDLSNAPVIWTEADLLAAVLDCRTLFAIPPRCADHARENLKNKYIELLRKNNPDQASSHTDASSSQSVISYFT